MKKNLNVIQINGFRGLVIAGLVVCCLIAGFVAFPGLVFMHIWNYAAKHTLTVPSIGLIQGILLWGIVVATYFTFKKDKLIVCVRTPKGLSEDELKSVFSELKAQSQEDLILKSMLKAREMELKNNDNNLSENSLEKESIVVKEAEKE